MKYLITNTQKQKNMLKGSLTFDNDSTILRIKHSKFSGYFFHMNPNI